MHFIKCLKIIAANVIRLPNGFPQHLTTLHIFSLTRIIILNAMCVMQIIILKPILVTAAMNIVRETLWKSTQKKEFLILKIVSHVIKAAMSMTSG
jgi:hypothetical protein